MQQTIFAIIPLFLLVLLGFILKKRNIGKTWSTVFNEYVVNIAFPFLIFYSLNKYPFSWNEFLPLITANSALIVGLFMLTIIINRIFNFDTQKYKTLFICIAFGNIAFLGMPIVTELYGPQITTEASIITAIYLFWIFSIGILFLEHQQKKNTASSWKKIFQNLVHNPTLLAIAIGITTSTMNLKIPDFIQNSLSMISASATPMILISIGLFIGTSDFKKISHWKEVILFSIFTTLITPLILFGILSLIDIPHMAFNSSVIQAAMPLAITPFALADQYKLDKSFISNSIILSTVLSILTIPLVAHFLTK
ncbi:hypothetical protein CSB37_02390 [bacterium DOLZORAL124_38_8]|nr:MAG: hypothetical protein CSB37_02390 [bacterium DOLZORAL124_38_8]